MHQTLVGRFRNPADAEVARNLLVADGIPVGDIKLRAHGARRRRIGQAFQSSGGLLRGIEHFLGHLVDAAAGGEDRDYAELVPPNGAVVVVTINDGHQSRIACAALADMGAIGIETR